MIDVIVDFDIELRDGINGDFNGVKVPHNSPVKIIDKDVDEFELEWVHVEFDAKTGWTLSVNMREPTIRIVDELAFAESAVFMANTVQANAGYLIAVAHVESREDWRDGIIAARSDDRGAIAPFRFDPDTWASLSKSEEGRILGLRTDGIKFPSQQILAEGLRSKNNKQLLLDAIPRSSTTLDLFLARLFGVAGAVAIISPSNKTKKIKNILSSHDVLDTDIDNTLSNRQRLTKNLGGDVRADHFLAACRSALQAGLDEARKLLKDLPHSPPPDPETSFDQIPANFNGERVVVSQEDIEALSRLAHAEAGSFAGFGPKFLKDGIGAVVDTVINRIVDDSGEFENSIQSVIDERNPGATVFQFSPLNGTANGTWRDLDPSNSARSIVDAHLIARAKGNPGKIKGAMHFFNPAISNPSWGPDVIASKTYVSGNSGTNKFHVHGFPVRPGGVSYKPPGKYAIFYKGLAHAFEGDGTPLAAFEAPTDHVDLTAALTSQIKAGKITFQATRFQEMLLGKEFFGKRVTAKLQRLVLELSTRVSSKIEISSVIRDGTGGSLHNVARAVDIGNESIAGELLPKVARLDFVNEFDVDQIIFDGRLLSKDANHFNFNRGVKSQYGVSTINDHDDHIHFAVKE